MPTGCIKNKVALAVGLLCALGSAPAPGATVEQSLAKARAQYRDLEYQKVITITKTVVKDARATVTQRVEAHELMGLSCLILGRQRPARQAFTSLLRLKPGHRLRDPSGSPKLRSFFRSVRDSLPPPARPPRLRLQPPGKARAGQRLTVKGVLSDFTWAGHIGLLRWRRAGKLTWHSTTATPEGGAILAASLLLPKSSSAYRLEYYMAVHDTDGIQVISGGTASEPLALEVSAARSSSLARRWWIWVAVGAVVVAGATVGIVTLGSEEAPKGNMRPGVIQLP